MASEVQTGKITGALSAGQEKRVRQMRSLRNLLPWIETTLMYRHDLAEVPGLQPDVRFETQALLAPRLDLLREIGPVDAGELAKRVARGDLCHVARLDGGRPVHFAWVQRTGRHHMEPAGVWFNVEATQAWIYDCYTAEWGRGRGVYTGVLAAILTGLQQSGARAACIYTTQSNTASQRGIDRVGFQLTDRFRSFRAGSRAALIGKIAVQPQDATHDTEGQW
jgi:hypothetical protein